MKKKRLARMITLGCLMMVLVCTMAMPAFATGAGNVSGAITDEEALEAAFYLTRAEGIIPALESSHALAALDKIAFNPEDVVVLTLSGRGDKDINTYLSYRG